MTRNFQVLCLALAVLGTSAVAATSAQASKLMTEGNVSAAITGEQVGTSTFTIEGGKVSCTTAKIESGGAVSSPAETWTVHPTYSGCTAFGLAATVNTTGCDYSLTPGKEVGEAEFDATVGIVCTGGSKIAISAGTCEVTIGAQSLPAGPLTNDPTGGPLHFLLHFIFGGVQVSKVKDGFLCPLNGTGETTGAAAATTTWWGWFSGEEVGVTVEP